MRRRGGQSGSALVELAGALILLVTLLTGTFETGYTFYTYENLVNAVRAGARYGSVAAQRSTNNIQLTDSVRNLVLYGDPHALAGKPVVPGLEPRAIEVNVQPASITVAVRGFVIDALFAKIPLDGRPTVTFPLMKQGEMGGVER